MFSLADKIRQIESTGKTIVDLSLGQPEVPAPSHISKAMQASLLEPFTSYSSSAGSENLRGLIARDLGKRSGIETSPREILVTSGSKHALFITLLSTIDSGDEVLVYEPFFPPYSEILALIDGTLKTVPIVPGAEELKPDVDLLLSSIGKKTRAVLLNYPNNPAGWTLEKDEVKRVIDHCTSRGIYVISDEIYDHIVFDGRTHCPAWTFSDHSENIVHIGSFSKTYSMVPYRLGFLAAKKKVCEGVLKAQRATITMVSPFVQSAGIAALEGPQDFVTSRLAKYEQRRNKSIELLRGHGLDCPKPSGAFYIFMPLPAGAWTDAFDFTVKFLEECGVAVLPGGIFGERWKNYIRISIATEDSKLFTGLERLCSFCESHKPA
jgi:aspartate/methionine/tyrosine aminotransferase